jgi:hypothetical protein
VAGWKALVGQASEVPSQTSSTSHGPAAGRQTVPLDAATKPHAPLRHATTWQGSVAAGQTTPQAPQLLTSDDRSMPIASPWARCSGTALSSTLM